MVTRAATIVYVDGFNLFYGALKGSNHKWLDLESYFLKVRNNDDKLLSIKYFTSLIHGPQMTDQQRYLDALATRPLLQIVLGNFKEKKQECRVTSCT